VARNTLWAVCERQAHGRLIIQHDNQWWDQVIWAQGAWTHFLVTGDREFLLLAYEAVAESLAAMRRTRFNERFGLFEGPSVLCDGIAGYPEPPYDPKVSSSFILDHPGGDNVMCLSTNCVAYQAYRCAAWMAGQLGRPATETSPFTETAGRLREAIQRHFWMPAKSTYGCFIHGRGPLAGKLDDSQEGMGLAYAILFHVAEDDQVRSILRTVHIQPKGIVCAWPHFARFNDARPGRHNVLVWPMASGMWAHAAAKAGAVARFASEMTNTAAMANASQFRLLGKLQWMSADANAPALRHVKPRSLSSALGCNSGRCLGLRRCVLRRRRATAPRRWRRRKPHRCAALRSSAPTSSTLSSTPGP